MTPTMQGQEIRKGLNSRWPDIRRLSRSSDTFDRTTALAQAVACIEVGLTAVGIPPDRIQARVRRAIQTLDLRRVSCVSDIQSAIRARNKAVHEHRVPSTAICGKHISTLHKFWNSTRRCFVNRQQASRLAAALLEITGIADVFLFGSLAHGTRAGARDIDLLLFDDGTFSSFTSGYRDLDFAFIEQQLDSSTNRYPIVCGWLDFVFVDAVRFAGQERDADYIAAVMKRHRDPLFFVNLSDGLLRYDRATGEWMDSVPRVFQRLAGLRKQLETELIVSPQSKKRTKR